MTSKPTPSFRLLCVMTHHVCDALGDNETNIADVIDELKWAIARARLEYPTPRQMTAVAEAVMSARAKGYRTPK